MKNTIVICVTVLLSIIMICSTFIYFYEEYKDNNRFVSYNIDNDGLHPSILDHKTGKIYYYSTVSGNFRMIDFTSNHVSDIKLKNVSKNPDSTIDWDEIEKNMAK